MDTFIWGRKKLQTRMTFLVIQQQFLKYVTFLSGQEDGISSVVGFMGIQLILI
jgi:hypothetical protein